MCNLDDFTCDTKRNKSCICLNYSDGGRPSSGGTFISGFVLGGIIVGTLGAVYAPQVCDQHNNYISS